MTKPNRVAVIALVILLAVLVAACWCIGCVVSAVRGEFGWEEQ